MRDLRRCDLGGICAAVAIIYFAFGADAAFAGPRPAPTGALAVVDGTQVVTLRADGRDPRTLRADVAYGNVDWSRDGRWLAFANTRGLRLLDVATRATRTVRTPAGAVVEPLFSRNGRRIFFLHSRSQTNIRYDLWSIGVGGKGLTRHTRNADLSMVAISPDGRRIAFVRESVSNGLGRIYVAHPDGSGGRLVARGLHPAFSPDGTSIAYTSARGISITSSKGGKSRLIVPQGLVPTFSPDGRWIAFLRDVRCPDHAYCLKRVFLVPADGGTATAIGPELADPGRFSWIRQPPARQIVDSYCSRSGDLCYGVVSIRGALHLQIDTFEKYFARYRLCVRAPGGDEICKTFAIGPRDRLYGSSVRWSSAFPRRAGVHVVTWRLGTGRLGPPLRVRLG